ncbi:putative flagellar basal body rod protein [Magnetofaba australis IT-1]|uniref:Flagellar basal-body rod protein FlgF n=2 Tax=Magnetofaba TaxID=1472292 RepID=A0A1Y2K358_9PROT|nr:putative flagellar basal body rod protein [Magnetofaba australis IT-1]
MKLDVLANNLANVNTTGFKEDQLTFDSFMTSPGPEQFPLPTDNFMGLRGPYDIPFPFSNPASNAYRMTYPVAFETEMTMTQGPLRQTGNPLDVAIEGDGFFAVQGPDGERRYTRDGAFEIDSLGQLVTKDGFPLLNAGGAPIVVGKGPVVIGEDGVVTSAGEQVGVLSRVGLPTEQLDKVGQNLYKAPQEYETNLDGARGGFHQGFLEDSNSNPIRSMTQMIETQRATEMYVKMIQSLDTLDEKAANQVGRLE